MTRDFDVILDEAISRVEAGEAVEECLASYPGHATLLAPLLRMAAFSRRALADVEPLSESASVAGKQRLLAAAAQQRFLAAAATQAPAASQKKLAQRPKKRRGPLALRARVLAAAALALLLLVTVGGGLAAVSADSLPGDLLYPIKLGTEQVRLFLTVDSQAKEDLLEGFADERRAEAAAVLESGREVGVAFEGTLERVDPSLWTIGGLQVTLDAHTIVEGDPWVGATVAVEGLAPGDGSLVASRLTVKGPGKMHEPTATGSPTMAPQFTMTPFPRETNTACPTRTHAAEMTCTSCATLTHEPEMTCTSCPTKTHEPRPTDTLCPTHTPYPTETSGPNPTSTVYPTENTEPVPTPPPQPTASDEPKATRMSHPTKTPHH